MTELNAPGPELLEIVEVRPGEIVLRRADSSQGSGEPLVLIRFSGEAQDILGGAAGALGKSMIASGLQMVGQMFRQQAETTIQDEESEGEELAIDDAPGADRHRLH